MNDIAQFGSPPIPLISNVVIIDLLGIVGWGEMVPVLRERSLFLVSMALLVRSQGTIAYVTAPLVGLSHLRK